MKDFTITRVGLVQMQICTCLSVKKAIKEANVQNPTGLSHGWSLTNDATLAPIPCDDAPKTHKHYILVC